MGNDVRALERVDFVDGRGNITADVNYDVVGVGDIMLAALRPHERYVFIYSYSPDSDLSKNLTLIACPLAL